MKSKYKITKSLAEVYKKSNPSTYFVNNKRFKQHNNGRKKLLLNLKLPPKLFKNSTLIDFGSGSGQNTISYDNLGASCTLVEYDKKSCKNSKVLFKKFSKNKYKIINKDIYKYKSAKKFDFVVSHGVIHHTKNIKKTINICSSALKKGGFLILSTGEQHGFFQRNIQRLILYKISKNQKEIFKYAKILFKDHLKRSTKFGGRSINEIISDTYLNPKINTLTTEQILKEFKKNNINFYSSKDPLLDLRDFSQAYQNQYHSFGKRSLDKKKGNYLHYLNDFSLSNQKNDRGMNSFFLRINKNLDAICSKVNDLNFSSSLPKMPLKNLTNLKKKINGVKKINIVDVNHNKKFIDEMLIVFKILNSNETKERKFNKLRSYLKKTKVIFKRFNGVGMKYFTGYKLI
jgi:2-polyprenyl-3-methyl-5-hydroxy-6-metoxy-1,4-benzoquinol methylase